MIFIKYIVSLKEKIIKLKNYIKFIEDKLALDKDYKKLIPYLKTIGFRKILNFLITVNYWN